MSHRCHVLLVEDNSDDAYMFMRAAGLGCPGMDVSLAGDPLEAIKRLEATRTPAEPLDLIVSDLKMPLVNGIEFISWLRSRPEFETLPVILLSSSSEERDVQDAYAAGATLYMVKPTEANDYTLLLRQIGSFCEDGIIPSDQSFLVPRPHERV